MKAFDMVQWSSGYDFCLTFSVITEGLQFDPGLNQLFVVLWMMLAGILELD
jgi:hypothetical protein